MQSAEKKTQAVHLRKFYNGMPVASTKLKKTEPDK
jgi:hypothetical protein